MTELDRRDLLKAGVLALGLSALRSVPGEAAEADDLERRAARLEDAWVVENMINSYPQLQHAGMYEDILAMFALNRSDVRVNIRGVGIWQGSEAVRKAVVGIPEQVDLEFHRALHAQFPGVGFQSRAGRQFEMPTASTVVHVAQDGKTAKLQTAAWGPNTGVTRDGKIGAFWVAENYAIDYIKESDGWKFWHFQIVPVFRTPHETSWVETARNPATPSWLKGPLAPTRASKEAAHAYDPEPPRPYETFARTWSY